MKVFTVNNTSIVIDEKIVTPVQFMNLAGTGINLVARKRQKLFAPYNVTSIEASEVETGVTTIQRVYISLN
jgi:hypothetical protein